MNISRKELQQLLEVFDRLRRENALRREAAGSHITDQETPKPVVVTRQVLNALLR